jgi:DNA-directed RNA polymerase specialized sigma subunit
MLIETLIGEILDYFQKNRTIMNQILEKTTAIESKVDSLTAALDSVKGAIETEVAQGAEVLAEVRSLKESLADNATATEALDRIDAKLSAGAERLAALPGQIAAVIPDAPAEPEPTE